MSPFRDAIRFAIFGKLTDDSRDISQTVIQIDSIIKEYTKKIPNFEQDEKINIELTVPIKLPPNGNEGDCREVVDTIAKSFNKLGGGSRISSANGSWLDQGHTIVSDHCLIIFTSMLISDWYESIPVLRQIIRDEIQTKLRQKCVYLRIDNNSFGEPINLLGETIDTFPDHDEFGAIDPACIPLMVEYEEQTSSGFDTITAIGKGAIAIKGDLKIVTTQGVNPEKHAQLMAENMRLKEELAKITDEQESSKEEREDLLKRAESVEHVIPTLGPWELTKLGKIARLQGRFERAIGYYQMALHGFLEAENLSGVSASHLNICSALTSLARYEEAIENANFSHVFALLSNDMKGAIHAVSNIATIESNKGNFAEAEEWYKEALEMQRKLTDEIGIASTLVNLSSIQRKHRKVDDAENSIQSSLDICRKESDYEGIVIALSNLGSLLAEEYQKHSEAEQKFLEAIEICKDKKLLRLEVETKAGLANLYSSSGRKSEARSLYNEILVFERKNELKKGLVATLIGLALLETKDGNLREAEKRLTEAKDIAITVGLRPEMAVILNNLGITLCEQSKIEKHPDVRNEKMLNGIGKCIEAYDLAKKLGMEQDMLNPLYNLGCSLMFVFQENLYDRTRIIERITLESYSGVRELPWQAEQFFREGLELSQKLDEKNHIGNFLFHLGHVAGCKAELAHFLQKHEGAIGQKEIEYNKARDFFQQALKIFQQLGNTEREKEVVEFMQHLDRFK